MAGWRVLANCFYQAGCPKYRQIWLELLQDMALSEVPGGD